MAADEIVEQSFLAAIRLSMDVCPNCGTEMGPATCCMTYSTWHCWGCGADLDGRVVTPKSVKRCENEWPDYERHLGDPIHPLACSCTGRGWYEWDSAVSGGSEVDRG